MEVGNALFRIARKQASAVIHHFQTADEMTLISLNPTLFNTAMLWYDKHQWGLVDCVSFAVMDNMQLSVALAFDRHFIQAWFQLVD